jgi:hypothetical protein
MLSKGTKNTLRDVLLCAIGAFAGSVVPLAKVLEELFRSTNPEHMNFERFFCLLVTIVAIAAIGLTGFLLWTGSEDGVQELVKKIRGRKRALSGWHDLSGGDDEPS